MNNQATAIRNKKPSFKKSRNLLKQRREESATRLAGLFKNYELSEEEVNLLLHYEGATGIEPSLGDHDGVTDRAGFVEYMRKNVEWYRDHSEEALQSIERNFYEFCHQPL